MNQKCFVKSKGWNPREINAKGCYVVGRRLQATRLRFSFDENFSWRCVDLHLYSEPAPKWVWPSSQVQTSTALGVEYLPGQSARSIKHHAAVLQETKQYKSEQPAYIECPIATEESETPFLRLRSVSV